MGLAFGVVRPYLSAWLLHENIYTVIRRLAGVHENISSNSAAGPLYKNKLYVIRQLAAILCMLAHCATACYMKRRL